MIGVRMFWWVNGPAEVQGIFHLFLITWYFMKYMFMKYSFSAFPPGNCHNIIVYHCHLIVLAEFHFDVIGKMHDKFHIRIFNVHVVWSKHIIQFIDLYCILIFTFYCSQYWFRDTDKYSFIITYSPAHRSKLLFGGGVFILIYFDKWL